MGDSEGGDNAFFDDMGGLQTMGILNALKTGDPTLDMLLAMCLPFVIKFIFDASSRLEDYCRWDYWRRWRESRDVKHHRLITHQSTRNSWGGSTSLDPNSQNTILLKAIQLYLHAKVKLDMKAANLDLTSTQDEQSSIGGYYNCDSDDNENDSRTIVGILSKFKIVQNPPRNAWHKLGSYGKTSPTLVELRIMDNEETSGDGKQNKHTRTFEFRSSDGGAIDAFVDTAFDWYIDELRKLEDNSRYLYELKSIGASSSSSEDDESPGGTGSTYARYRLSDEKTFESLFFREKQPLLSIVEHFRNRSGKYAVKGYPHKLGVLLHGPPGTGKTSLIKALAQHTGRSIVNVPLARITTNAELQSIFFDKTYNIQGQYVPVKLAYKDIIFVMEDVDAASKVVRRRDGKRGNDMVQMDYGELPSPKSMWHMLVESSESECQDLVKLLMEKSELLKKEVQRPEFLQSMARRMMVLPELGLVGESGENPTLHQIGQEAVESAQGLMQQYSAVDSFVRVHAKRIKLLLDSGAKVDKPFVDALLGKGGPPSLPALIKPSMSREMSDTDRIHAEREAQMLAEASSMAASSIAAKSESKSSLEVVGPSLPWKKAGVDQLNLTGILNVLDGVVDTPGRIVIMTTNHPEMLDPALIRPGRIDRKLHLGFMAAIDVTDMLQHYFQTSLDAVQRERVGEIIASGLEVTPAQVEQLTAEHDEVDAMISALEEKARPYLMPSTSWVNRSPTSIIG